jgi:hypothetical protein
VLLSERGGVKGLKKEILSTIQHCVSPILANLRKTKILQAVSPFDQANRPGRLFKPPTIDYFSFCGAKELFVWTGSKNAFLGPLSRSLCLQFSE